ncbi:MAG: TlyA family RNA methyltransferase [Desulfovibrio sp.]|nr:TlyA family RNA methyltransferase [Desulfovibrio sp.]
MASDSPSKRRADLLVYEQGLAESREKAARLIMAGKIFELVPPASGLNESARLVTKAGHQYPPCTRFVLAKDEPFVSRGAYKLLTALENFQIDVRGFVCLDAGASTGGFTDCLLQRGAVRVYAVDVGRNQLHEKLRRDERVVSLEGVNLRQTTPDMLPEPVDMVTADVAFISLTLVLPPCMFWLKAGGRAAVLIKPQFELGPGETVKGVVRDEAARKRAVDKIVSFGERELGLRCDGVTPAAVRGPKGNQEYMAVFSKAAFVPNQRSAPLL